MLLLLLLLCLSGKHDQVVSSLAVPRSIPFRMSTGQKAKIASIVNKHFDRGVGAVAPY